MSEARGFRQQIASNTLVHVAFGFLAMGAWAVFANREHPMGQALLAGVVQGLISGVLTLLLKKGLEHMSAMFFRSRSHEGGGNTAALIAPPLITATAVGIILTTAHTLVGTPEVLTTIAVPFTVSTSYAILYNLRLWRTAHGR